MYDQTWVASLMLLPRPDLMTRKDEGLLTFCGLYLSARFRWKSMWNPDPHPRIWFDVWSDADEIATRLARTA